jgi:hypothetical protein
MFHTWSKKMSEIRKGTITAGEYCGWSVIVDDDRAGETGGYYLYIKKANNLGFDYWFEAEAGLEAQLEDFEVDWGN